MASKEFAHIFWCATKPVIIMTVSNSVNRFFQTKMIPPPLWNACDFVLQFNFTIAHIPGKINTAADFLSCLEMDPNEKINLKTREDVPPKPIEVNIESTGLATYVRNWVRYSEICIQDKRINNIRITPELIHIPE